MGESKNDIVSAIVTLVTSSEFLCSLSFGRYSVPVLTNNGLNDKPVSGLYHFKLQLTAHVTECSSPPMEHIKVWGGGVFFLFIWKNNIQLFDLPSEVI